MDANGRCHELPPALVSCNRFPRNQTPKRFAKWSARARKNGRCHELPPALISCNRFPRNQTPERFAKCQVGPHVSVTAIRLVGLPKSKIAFFVTINIFFHRLFQVKNPAVPPPAQWAELDWNLLISFFLSFFIWWISEVSSIQNPVPRISEVIYRCFLDVAALESPHRVGAQLRISSSCRPIPITPQGN
jgi:hypothetical protein